MKINYYEVLGVERSASEQEIRDRFRQLARDNHPDRVKGTDKSEAERKFQTLTEAVNVLTNPAKRKQHDAELSVGINKGTADLTREALPPYTPLRPNEPVHGWVAITMLTLQENPAGYAWLRAYQPVQRVGGSFELFDIQ